MKISFPRHIVYLSVFTIFMIIFAIWFSLEKLIPMGKEYRKNRLILKKERIDFERYEEFHKKTLTTYNETKTKNRNIIEAFKNSFDPQRFKQEYQKYFIDLTLSKSSPAHQTKWYEVYEVNTTSKIKTPKNFYDFLEAINKSEWIVGVTFPIKFSRQGELIHSSFKMQVYKKAPEQKTPNKEEEKADS